MTSDPIVHTVQEEAALPPRDSDSTISSRVSAKHRAILEAALAQTSSRSFGKALASMPNVGEDSDFRRSQG